MNELTLLASDLAAVLEREFRRIVTEVVASELAKVRTESPPPAVRVQTPEGKDAKAAAQYLTENGLKTSPRTLENWRYEGRGPEFRQSLRKRGAPVGYTRDALDRFLAEHSVDPSDEHCPRLMDKEGRRKS